VVYSAQLREKYRTKFWVNCIKWTVSQDMYGVKVSNLGHIYFNINVTSQKKISSIPRFAEMLTLKHWPLQNCFNSSALSEKWT